MHVLLDESHAVPLVYCVARNKNQATYDMIFSTLKQVKPDLNTVSVTTDYERAALNSVTASFPNTNIYGCFFHFGLYFWREIQRSELQTWYTDTRNAITVKYFQALALVPVSDVPDTYIELVSTFDNET